MIFHRGERWITLHCNAVGQLSRTATLRKLHKAYVMSIIYRFIEAPSEASTVLTWFRELDTPPIEIKTDWGVVLHFSELGPLQSRSELLGEPSLSMSPVVALILPTERRGLLWGVGEIRFVTTPLKKTYPKLYQIDTRLSEWLETYECIFSLRKGHPKVSSHDYYLEGSVRNDPTPIWALPSGLDALREGQYFVSAHETKGRLEDVCRALRLRGLQCTAG